MIVIVLGPLYGRVEPPVQLADGSLFTVVRKELSLLLLHVGLARLSLCYVLGGAATVALLFAGSCTRLPVVRGPCGTLGRVDTEAFGIGRRLHWGRRHGTILGRLSPCLGEA